MASLDPKLVLKLVPNFSGNPRELHKFISCSELIHKSLKDTDKSQFLELVKLKLDGKAYDIIKYTEVKSWKNLKDLLVTEFTETRSVGHLQMELATLKQNKGEDVRSYASRLESILYSLNETCIAAEGIESAQVIKNLNEHIALKSFQEGLNDSIKNIVKACRFTSLSAAINRASEEEMVVKNFSTLKASDKPCSSRSFAKYCQNCNKPGHLKEECFRRQRITSTAVYPPFQASLKPISTIRCAYCKKIGHHIQECFLKKRSDDRRQQTSSQQHPPSVQSTSFPGNETRHLKLNRGTPSRVQEK